MQHGTASDSRCFSTALAFALNERPLQPPPGHSIIQFQINPNSIETRTLQQQPQMPMSVSYDTRSRSQNNFCFAKHLDEKKHVRFTVT
jgi:hypothetical protein